MALDKAWTTVGAVGVDAGLIWLGDPCYILHQDKNPQAIGKDWNDFCNILQKNEVSGFTTFAFDRGHNGLGVTVQSGHGDGYYPVKVKRDENGTIMQVMIDFTRFAKE